MRLYHGTVEGNVSGILREGLRMRREIPDEPTLAARVCLTDSIEEAEEWGDGTVVVVDVPNKWVHRKGYGEMGERQVHHNIPPAMIVEVIRPR